MAFDVAGGAYQQFMGEFSDRLCLPFLAFAGIDAAGSETRTVADVGCGPGVLTAHLVDVLGVEGVHAVDPSAPFVEAARARLPGVDIRQAGAEALPFEDACVDAALAQLVVLFMDDPVRGVGEMVRVTRPGGVVAASVWDHGGGRGPLSLFWSAVSALDPTAETEAGRTGARDGDLVRLLEGAGLRDVVQSELTVSRPYAGFDAWWEPYTLGVGTAGDHLARLDEPERERLREQCRAFLPDGPFHIDAVAWAARGRV